MKKFLNLILSFTLIFNLGTTAFATTGGDGNIDGGGGSMDTGTGSNYWNSGYDGVRVTVVNADTYTAVTTPIDFSNINISGITSDIYHFGKVSKLSYNTGRSLNFTLNNYRAHVPVTSIPRIITTGDGVNNIEALKQYFCSEYFVQLLANETGMNYDILIAGRYKILIEPIAYFTYQGSFFAMTATEAALYDQVVSGNLRTLMGNLTHKNLPLSMFLETGDLGYAAWTGSRTDMATNNNIISTLGLGVVRFEEATDPPATTYDYEYRTSTEVITSVDISGGQSDPDNPVTVHFEIDGTTYTVSNVYYPAGDSQIAWVKWTTPDTPQDMVINVSTSGGGSPSQSTINIKIVDLNLNPPPNPVADDRNDSFTYSDVPDREEKDRLTWTVWSPWWQEYWVDRGSWVGSYPNRRWRSNWVDEGWWEFDCDSYYASLSSVDMDLLNDPRNPTATSSSMKSGYGVNIYVKASVRSNQTTSVSSTPNAVTYFPEFGYESYWRLLERTRSGSTSEFEFKENVYSIFKNPTHFTPIWMPDGPYIVNTHIIDYWCPTGMLCESVTDQLTISGNMWMDWHIGPT